ncbi:chitinase [Pelomonas sp. SE-A7]|uniref:chitinase n=1 Tax=Pelomonas sp. SE-A7 TaxID=3054953 RepID=UPI00259CA0E0|nr:chitinase [Pelomonas sp. SE-A7]MDM4767942.1 chitinase [Pelomonas sp. SE-A7]
MRRLACCLTALVLAACASQPSDDAPFLPSEAEFAQLFPQRIAFYDHAGFVAAVQATPGFASRGNPQQRRQEMAAFLAQIAHESDQLRAQREYNRAAWDHYCRRGPGEDCAPGQQYYGRGPIQLSWNYQYLAAGRALGLDLWSDPDLVARDSRVAWRTALWYWMNQTGPSDRSAHAALQAGAGFGATTRAINGVLECDKGEGSQGWRQQASRVAFYQRATALFGVEPLGPLHC